MTRGLGIAGAVGLSIVAFAPGLAVADQLGDVLGIVPKESVAWAVAPNLSRLNADLGDLIDRADRPELAVAGRPIDALVAQFGVAAGFDERGSLAIWSPTASDLRLGHGVVAIPVESGERFIEANLDPEPSIGPNAGRLVDGTLLHHRMVGDHVLLAPRPDLLDPAAGGVAIDSLESTFGPEACGTMRQADLILRIDGTALADLQQSARDRAATDASIASDWPLGRGGVDSAALFERFERLGGGVTDAVIAIDVDALALGIRGWTRYEAESALAALAAEATPVSRPVLSALPEGPYYLAFGVDIASFGGARGLRRLAGVLGDDVVPTAALAMLDELEGIAFSTRPSKLGVAMGGVLNDASLVLVAADPSATRQRLESILLELNGVQGAIARQVSFKRDAPQRRGGDADEITMTADVAAEADREPGARLGDASIRLTAERMIFGPRGWLGLGRAVDGAYVVTFSRRPDVMTASMTAADGLDAVADGGRGLASDPTLVAMRDWLPPQPGLEAFLDVGRLVGLARQLASLIPGADAAIPEIPEAMPPVGFGASLASVEADAVLAWGVVVPSEVVGAAVGAGIQQAMEAAGGPVEGQQ